jgi:hypothetical protein
VWVAASEVRERTANVRCRACGRRFEFSAWSRICSAGAQVSQEARRMALADGIDLPGAYSVALGIMTLDDVRQKVAARLRGADRQDQAVAVKLRPANLPLLCVLFVVVTLAAVWQLGPGRPSLQRRGPTRSISVGAAQVLTDRDGRVLQVSAADPRSVLTAFCRAGRSEGRFEALDVVPSTRDPARARLGLLRDPAEQRTVLAITIAEDREARRWVAGDGRAPLEAAAAPSWATAASGGH